MRPAVIWCVVLSCLVVLLAAMGWVTGHTLRLEKSRQEADLTAARQEQMRLAMYRLDLAANGLVIRENARPVQDYQAFHAADSVYNKAYAQVPKGEVLVPSPLLAGMPDDVLLHFQVNANGRLTSPQAPDGNARDLAESGYSETEKLALADGRLAELRRVLPLAASPQVLSIVPTAACAAWSSQNGSIAGNWRKNPPQEARIPGVSPSNVEALWTFNSLPPSAGEVPALPQPAQRMETGHLPQGDNDANLRNRNAVQQKTQTLTAPLARKEVMSAKTGQPDKTAAQKADAAPVMADRVQPLQGFWLDGRLLLTRSATVDGQASVQGAWLDWEKLRRAWLLQVRDLLPGAALEAAPLAAQASIADDPFRLAMLPVKLLPGAFPVAAAAAWTPLHSSLAAAWLCVLLAAAAVAVLLHRTVALSERRAAFVSAVTHELRTPLTTFRLYSEMLAEDMVADAGARKNYLETMHGEANRLGHLVENVLAYSRLERGSARRRLETRRLDEVLRSILPRLAQRAAAAEAVVDLQLSAETGSALLTTDAAALEQVLFNLVDNACKYAVPVAGDHTIRLCAKVHPQRVEIQVRDHGPGIAKREARRIFRAFHKSADDAARSAPGVGLGLALSRRLCAELGGQLRHENCPDGRGACFVIDLPLEPNAG